VSIDRAESLKEGVKLFNEERFWESHEVLEQIWRESKGLERDAVQSLILTAAAFVHYQKNETDICVSVLKRARSKANDAAGAELIYLDELKEKLDPILASGNIRLFKLGLIAD
jgi:predicted metal-dependent hydrolase